jgi:hypothetical protein
MRGKRLGRMIGGALSSSGGVYLDTSTILLLLVLAVVIIVGVVLYLKQQNSIVIMKDSSATPTILEQTDPRFNPMSPERSYFTGPDLRGYPSRPILAGMGATPINALTQGLGVPEQDQQIGVLAAPGGTDNSATPNRTLIPLFGRRAASNRDRWNYYTRSDGMNPLQVPIRNRNRPCDDDNGCDEIFDGDSVSAPLLGQSYTATIYRTSTPRYLPGIL